MLKSALSIYNFFQKFSTKKLKNIEPTMKYLNVAEKHDAAKTITNFLSNGTARRREGFSVYNKIFDFEANVRGAKCKMVMTSVSGHLLNYAFLPSYKGWQNCDPAQLFDAPIRKIVTENGEPIKKTLEREIKSCQGLIIWTDCDREGENIGFEIIEVCKTVRPNLQIYRAKFSEITAASIRRALTNLAQPDMGQNLAVEVRMEMDLRTGAAFTRYQTLRLQRLFPQNIANKLISYGSCQIPTLGFVCERYKEAEEFVSEPFWKLKVIHTKEELTVEFSWDRVRLFDKEAVEDYLMLCLADPKAKVEKVTVKPKNKWRPQPMDTVEMEKLGSRKLKINAKDMMAIAEKLYNQGYISYPRTETNSFSKEINLRNLVEQHTPHPQWGEFANRVLVWGPSPRNGNKSDQAHPPIHPIKLATNLSGNEARVYELIARHFLACVSKDATGSETIVNIQIAGEKFHANGLVIFERNYLDVYPYEKWNAKQIHHYEVNEEFDPTEISMEEGATTAPPLLTEADLITLMEKHGIGTDATHAEHIHRIKERGYIGEVDRGLLVPGTIGMGLWEGYNAMEMELAKPLLRAEFEIDLKKVCTRQKDPKLILGEQIAKYKEAYRKITERIIAMDEKFGLRINEVPITRRDSHNIRRDGNGDDGGSGGGDDGPGGGGGGGGGNNGGRGNGGGGGGGGGSSGGGGGGGNGRGGGGGGDRGSGPDEGGGGRHNNNNSSGGSLASRPADQYVENDNQQTPQISNRIQQVFKCPKCDIGHMALKTKKDKSGYYISCLNFPECKNAVWFDEHAIKEVKFSEECCNCCQEVDVHKLQFKFKQLSYLAMLNAESTTYLTCIRCDTKFQEIFEINLDKVKNTGRIISDKNTGFERWGSFNTEDKNNYSDKKNIKEFKNLLNKNNKTAKTNLKKQLKPKNQSNTTKQKKSKILTTQNNTRLISTSSLAQNNLDLALEDINFDDSWDIELKSDQNLLNDDNDELFSSLPTDIIENQNVSNLNKNVHCDKKNWGSENYQVNQFENKINSNNNNSNNSVNVNPASWFSSWGNLENNNNNNQANMRTNTNQSQSSYNGWNNSNSSTDSKKPKPNDWETANRSEISNVRCPTCEKPAKELTVKKEGPNKNRIFFVCSFNCKFFQWADEIKSVTTTQQNKQVGNETVFKNTEEVNCTGCNTPAKSLTVKKEGPNKGRPFYVCANRDSNCEFFKWADENTNPNIKETNNWGSKTVESNNKPRPKRSGNDNQPKKRKCGLCRLDGHTRLKCPRKAEFETDT